MRVLTTVAETRRALDKEREAGRTVGFVPTMGYLHDGHASLIERARRDNTVVAVSIFVNPLQFGANEDLSKYPRDLDRDLALCEQLGVEVVFHPSVDEMYPEPNPFLIRVGPIGERLCGATRPGHFDGVATVVAKLFNIAGPSRAYFGEKDAQQLVIIKRLVDAFNAPVVVVGCPTVRERDGLALSSRNIYLDAGQRRAALVLKRALDAGAALVPAGDGRRVADEMRRTIEAEPRVRLDYAACVDPKTLEDLSTIEGPSLLAVAAWVGKARLIDNVTVTP